jgi:hypothetical protein
MANSRGKKNSAVEFRNNSLKMEPHKRSKGNVREILENMEDEREDDE